MCFSLDIIDGVQTINFRLLMMERTNAKGAGVHWDIVLLCLINCLGAFIGGPWICAATVRAVAHVSSLVGILCFKFSPNPLTRETDITR